MLQVLRGYTETRFSGALLSNAKLPMANGRTWLHLLQKGRVERERSSHRTMRGKEVRVLVACEFSGIVRDAFARRGHDAWSCDLLPTERLGNHIQADILSVLNDGWDLMIA